MQPEAIEKLITPHTKALMINTPNNPTGSVMTRETMAKIAEAGGEARPAGDLR